MPSNNLRNVTPEITHCLTSHESALASQLESLNLGNNLFTPNELLRLTQIILTSGHMIKLKKLVIAFSDLGEGPDSIASTLCQSLLKTSYRLEEFDIRCCGLKISDMQVLRQSLLRNPSLKIKTINAGLNQFNHE